MRVCTPHCGIAPESGSGGEVYERELLRDLAGLGVELHILLARGKPHDDVPGCRVHPVWPPKGLRWPVTPFVFPRYVKRVWDRHGFDLLRAHSVRYVGPAALLARRRYRLPVPIVTHHHHLDPSPLNPHLEHEERVLQLDEGAEREQHPPALEREAPGERPVPGAGLVLAPDAAVDDAHVRACVCMSERRATRAPGNASPHVDRTSMMRTRP